MGTRMLEHGLTRQQYFCLREQMWRDYSFSAERKKRVNYYYDTDDCYYARRGVGIRICRVNGEISPSVEIYSIYGHGQYGQIPLKDRQIPLCLMYDGRVLRLQGGVITYELSVSLPLEGGLSLSEDHYLGCREYRITGEQEGRLVDSRAVRFFDRLHKKGSIDRKKRV